MTPPENCPLAEPKAAEEEPEPVAGTMDEGTIDINGYKISGIRDLALMACGFLFGLKTITKK